MIEKILVVCEGNVCRSPMAAALLSVTPGGHKVTSAGWNAMVGAPAAPFAREIMQARGMNIDAHRGRQLGLPDCIHADLILVMDRRQRELIEREYPLARGKIFRLGEHRNIDVDDPFRQPRAVFERCAHLIEVCVADWQTRLKTL
ncbi:low molecular weight phosphotyrosine protein phosphatase [Paraburkholderia sp. Tr-20389]|uniref:low molecular weight protein-tyrosine-phosphatase n=1 Tax=Paraburkholderia sp. Tr-20389 TaxID=2703903 RepID=UPI0019804281|nr:low molecular weight protein-tyrosine-phosphatase [Paraburkholderia sp. Tr-20389]MBN3756904.1 low molecular weight phosphotyrosine protein phosphatase [Paraburkholderia sp. Tr-20389]